ncbi:dockerin type I repeat-containing protein [Ruminococcus difficilis]|uniref:Dockerin type I repeat-containing protein n=1 Tax=Ruminococcus difficilis TaxID=2763069 RepID=A0A935C4B6_9FIRM|nr:dockerin type I repeat-containing protein [Ruminococcus difficilis]MBQ1594179.1 dockerin type I repeat-containing protein [Ruminococcus sp.]MBK6089477.1 dockerin type I repeat-containing protein [Ruminococcus difficilis]MBQ1921306.1 dockerin type I repeat-containing protein [Ruminococcus sp.]MBQ2281079.1 dockerin type I repeat-containing protein [Ruminococcus sp.]MBQ2427385.1 dockerin type I repeat-containing protein [Ruminococcus sp.]
MKTTAKQLLAVLLALVMTVSFMTVMAVSTSAATTPVPVGTNGDIQGGTNHCEEFSTTYPDDPMPPVFEVIPKLVISQPELDYPAMPEYAMTQTGSSDDLYFYETLTLKASPYPYECNVALYSAIFPADPPEYCEEDNIAFYVRKDTEVTFRYHAFTDTLTVERNVDLEMTDSEYTLPYEETPTTMEPTSEPIGETLELYCILKIYRPDGAVMESGMYQAVMGFSPTFTADISDLPVFDTPYKATLNVYSCIWPDELVFSSDEWFYVRSEGTVSFRAYAPGGSLTISGDGVELTTDPDVTYPTTLPDVTTLPQEWTTSPATTAPAYHGDICFGDVDMNGKLTIADATLIQRAAIDLVKFSQNQLYLADVNGDSRISILDVTCIQKYLAEFRDGTALAGEFAMTLI